MRLPFGEKVMFGSISACFNFVGVIGITGLADKVAWQGDAAEAFEGVLLGSLTVQLA